MSTRESLIERVRAALQGQPAVREVAMFGGRAFMVNEKLAVSVGGDGNLLVRADPERADELLAVDGAHVAEMGARSMGRSWLVVTADAVADEPGLRFWLDVAGDYNVTLGAPVRRAKPRRSG